MGLLDLNDPGSIQDLATAFGLLTARQGQNTIAPLLMQNAQAKLAQQKMERENRANDLQQLSGAYSLLKQQEFGRMMQAQQSGQPYTPNSQLAQLESRMTELLGKSNLSSGQSVMGRMPPSAPMPVPNTPPPQSPPMSGGAMPPQQSLNIGGPAAGIPAQVWLAQDPTGKTYLEQLAKDRAPQNVRPGGTVAQMGPDGKYSAAFVAPQLGPGMQAQRDPSGNVSSASLIPGYLQGLAAVEAAKSGANAAGKLPFEKPDVVNTPGAPMLMTPSQQIEAATGQNPLSVSPQTQTARNTTQLAILQRERANATDPRQAQALDTEIQALTRAQSSGKPFGFTLQDQAAGAAQRELGQKIGGAAADVFTNGAASVQGKRMLAGMTDMAQSYEPGKFQPLKSQLAQYATGLGLDENTANRILGTNTGDIQGLTSAAIQMAGKLTRQTDAQPSQLQFLKTLESMPMAERTPQGFAKIMDYLNSMHDYNIDKMVALQQYLGKHQGDPSGFEAEWAEKSRDLPFAWNKTSAKPTPQNLQKNVTATFKAKQAIAAGKDPAAVKQRLIEQGFDPSGL